MQPRVLKATSCRYPAYACQPSLECSNGIHNTKYVHYLMHMHLSTARHHMMHARQRAFLPTL